MTSTDVDFNTMLPHTDKAQLDVSADALMNTLLNFDIAADRSKDHLRKFKSDEVEKAWGTGQSKFMGDPVKYPSVMAPSESP